MFDITLGKNKVSDYMIELKEDAKPYHAKSFYVPQIHSKERN